jgi:hypothetical protein
MLPSLSLLKSDAIATAGHEPEQYKKGQGDLNIVRDLPKDLQKKILEVASDGLGVPLLLVRNVLYKWDEERRETYSSKDDIFYIRLPDPADGKLDLERFTNDNYPFDMIFEGIVNLAGYNKTTTKTKFLNVRPTDANIPEQLLWDEEDATGLSVLDLVAEAFSETAVAVDKRPLFSRNTAGEQLLFESFPTFKSHVAIVMIVEDYD